MDPRKDFVCNRGHIINDKYHPLGRLSPCPVCERLDWEEEMQQKYFGKEKGANS